MPASSLQSSVDAITGGIMRMTKVAISTLILGAVLGLVSRQAPAQMPVTAATDQAALLQSASPALARNKQLVYDFWREVLQAHHVELGPKYMQETYIQHNPNFPTGRDGILNALSHAPKLDIQPTIQRPLVNIVAEGDLVVLSWVDARPIDPADKSRTYTTTAFDMFRIEHGKIAEHWDTAALMPPRAPQ
jgi:predicted SnoaL-like aldol condensation-catalyzing enzyme